MARRELGLNRQTWQRNQRPATLTWCSAPPKAPSVTHNRDGKQIETGSKSIVETNDRQPCWVIWHCLIGPFSLSPLLMSWWEIQPYQLWFTLSSFAIWWVHSLLKNAVITISYESICPSIRGNSQKARRENRDWIMRAETIKKLEAPNMINYTAYARHT